ADGAALPIDGWGQDRGLPVVLHAGREPKSPALKCDPHALCSPERVERIVRAHPRLRLVIPHLGCDDLDAYARLVCAHEHVFVDTSMVLADYFPIASSPAVRALIVQRPDRVLYGTDLPNI